MNKNLNVLVLFKLDENKKKELEEICPDADYTYTTSEALKDSEIENYDVILGSLSSDRVKASKRLKWLQLSSAGSDPFQKEGAFPENAILTNATGGYGLAIAEHMLGMLLSINKKINLYRDNQNASLWKDEGDVFPIYNSVTAVIGLGDIGGEFAKRMKALGSYIIGVRRSNGDKPDYVDEIYLEDQIEAVIKRADVVALALPGTKETKDVLSKERIALLKKNTIILNVGRGSAIDTEALTDAIHNGDIFGAGLDVTYPEPLPSDHRLWKEKNVIITPHISGGYHLEETYNRIIDICLFNFKAFINNKDMKNVVDFKRGY